jgi:hypothetical protein
VLQFPPLNGLFGIALENLKSAFSVEKSCQTKAGMFDKKFQRYFFNSFTLKITKHFGKSFIKNFKSTSLTLLL